MLTMENLRGIGVQPEEGLKRCMDNEEFYLSMVKMVPDNEAFQKLQDALDGQDLDAAFEAAHALKGMLSNLSLTPLQEPVMEITELLRSRTDMDYSEILATIMEQREVLTKLCE